MSDITTLNQIESLRANKSIAQDAFHNASGSDSNSGGVEKTGSSPAQVFADVNTVSGAEPSRAETGSTPAQMFLSGLFAKPKSDRADVGITFSGTISEGVNKSKPATKKVRTYSSKVRTHGAEGLLMDSTINGKPIGVTDCAEGNEFNNNVGLGAITIIGEDHLTLRKPITSVAEVRKIIKKGTSHHASGHRAEGGKYQNNIGLGIVQILGDEKRNAPITSVSQLKKIVPKKPLPEKDFHKAQGEDPPVQKVMHYGYDMTTEPYDITSGQKPNTLGKVEDAYNAGGSVIIMDSKYPQAKADTVKSESVGAFVEQGVPEKKPMHVNVSVSNVTAGIISVFAGAGMTVGLRKYTKLPVAAILLSGIATSGLGFILLKQLNEK
jgi:hypothetical protein